MTKRTYEYERGKLVEFTDEYQQNYTLGDPQLARYGVVAEDTNGKYVSVKTVSGLLTVHINRIQAYGWAGYVPEALEPLWEEMQPYDDECDDYPDL